MKAIVKKFFFDKETHANYEKNEKIEISEENAKVLEKEGKIEVEKQETKSKVK